MLFILGPILILIHLPLWVANIYIKKVSHRGLVYKLCQGYRGYWLREVGGFKRINTLTAVFMGIIVFFSGAAIYDYFNLNERYEIIESAKAEAKGYIYDSCNDRHCHCYYCRIKIDNKIYERCLSLYPEINVGDSVDMYYNKDYSEQKPMRIAYKKEHTPILFWEQLDPAGIFFKKKTGE